MNLEMPINKILVQKSLSQKDLAEELGVSPQFLNAVINGRRNSNILRYRLARHFKRSEAELFGSNGHHNQARRKRR